MSKTIKRKITVELPKPRELSKNRLSVFERLGSKKQKSIGISDGKSLTKALKKTLSAAVNISTTNVSINSVAKPDNVELEDVDPDMLEKKRAEIQKELEKQLKMESRKAAAKEAALRKRKRDRSSSSSSSSSTASGSSSSTSTSSSSTHASALKSRKGHSKRRDSSSSSDDDHSKKAAKKKLCHAKKEAKLQKIGHSKKLHAVRSSSSKSKKRSVSPASKKQRLISGQKVIMKSTKLTVDKHHRSREREKERERELQQREREREKERERLRLREKEHGRSRSPKIRPKSRSPKRLSRSRDLGKKSPLPRRPSPAKSRLSASSSSRSVTRRHDSRERDRREKERQDREAAREKERREALARCQERQRERERLAAKEKDRRQEEEDRKIDRLLPRPAERAMALAAARDRSRESAERDRHFLGPRRSIEKEHVGSYARGYIERGEDIRGYEHCDRRNEKDVREHGREFRRHGEDALRDVAYEEQYEDHLRRDDRRAEYAARATYDEQRHRIDREREWTRDELAARELARDSYDRPLDRHQPQREWDQHAGGRDGYDNREWSGITDKSNKQWDSRDRDSANWQQEENWDHYNEDKWGDQGHSRGHIDKNNEHNMSGGSGAGAGGGGNGGGGRRWANWRARRANHHNEYRRHEIFEERGEIYRRHINPQGNINNSNSTNNNSTTNSTSTPANTTTNISNASVASNSSNTNAEPQKPASPVPVRAPVPQQKTPEPQPTKPEEIIEKPTDVKEDDDDQAGEEIADDLSEISDEADDILNRQEEQGEKNKFQSPATEGVLETETNDKTEDVTEEETKTTTVESTSAEQKPEPPSKDIADEIDLDFEEISDGELEEEARIRGLGDALGVDWASLVEESKLMAREKSKSVESSARQRWQPHRILLDTGVSFKMAGDLFARKILQDAHDKLIDEIEEEHKRKIAGANGITTDQSTKIENVTGRLDTIKTENETVDIKDDIKEIYNLELHSLACVQVGTRTEATKRQQLVFNAVGPFSRALCAKRDIAMRRQLCSLPIKENNCKLTTTKQSSGYETIAVKLFQKALRQNN